jgi:AAA domain-containing protein
MSGETYQAIAGQWHTAAEIASATPEEVDWLWRDYLAFGTVVELDAKMKAGKSTFLGHLVRAVVEGRDFLERETKRTPVVWMTEEGNRTFRAILERAGLTDRDDIHVLSRRTVGALAWVEFVAAALDKLEQVGARWLIVDTLPKFAGFKADAENDSATAMETMRRLQQLSHITGALVLVTRHDRKEGGEIGDSARGSSAFGGDVDVILRLTRVGGKTPSRRKLEALGRFDETPEELVIDLDRGVYRVVGANDARDAALKALCEILDQEPRVLVSDYIDELIEAGHARKTVYDAVRWGVRCGVLMEEDERAQGSKRAKKAIWLAPNVVFNGA